MSSSHNHCQESAIHGDKEERTPAGQRKCWAERGSHILISAQVQQTAVGFMAHSLAHRGTRNASDYAALDLGLSVAVAVAVSDSVSPLCQGPGHERHYATEARSAPPTLWPTPSRGTALANGN